jgi:hypothetical protein
LVAYNGVGGTNASSDISFTTTATGSPIAKTTAATAITSTNGTINGTINPNGQVTTYYFQYGPTTSYGSVTPTTGVSAAGSNASVTKVNFILTGLTPLQITHYLLHASNGGGSSSGSDMILTNLPNAPTALTLNASNITAGHVVFDATINPGGSTNLYWFQYGPTASYGSLAPTNGLVAGLSTLLITNLSPSLLQGTTYHYQVITVNSGGSSVGGDMSFTTLPITPTQLGGVTLSGGKFVFTFTNATGASFSILSTNNLTVPVSSWPVIGTAVESPAGSGQYQFTNSLPATNPASYYLWRQP